MRNRCDMRQNISGGVRYLAWLIAKFHGDLRLATAAYYAGEQVIERPMTGLAITEAATVASHAMQRS